LAAALEASSFSNGTLPVIDVSGLSSSWFADRQAVGEQLRAACLDNGFFYAANHGVPAGLIDAVLAETRNFFDRSSAEKAAVDKSRSICNRGFEPIRAQTLERGAPPDLKESFYIGPDLPLQDPRVVARRFNHGPNLWPADMPGFRPTMKAYFAAMLDLSALLMTGIALSLGLNEDHFAAYCTEPLAILRLLHYPPQPADAAPGEKGAGAHSDFGGMTLLLQDEVDGLQVQGKTADAWLHAPPIPGTYVVNLGDMMARWTNGRYRSTRHRVVNASGRERYSVPFFLDGNPDHTIECLPGCLAPGDTPKYAPITVEGHLREMYLWTYP
jgi:isopenicillin N synthase-like dioxygenase